MSDATANSPAVPGQMVLSGFEEILQCESRTLKKAEQERFCWEFVTNGGKPGPAYRKAINPDASDDNARSYACKLLKKSNIAQRVSEIAQIIRQKYMNEVIAFRVKSLHFDPARFFGPTGLLQVQDLPEELRKGIGLEAKIVDGCMRYLPVFPSPEKAADALQKIFEMNREGLALTGPNGGPIETVERPKLTREEWLEIHGLNGA
jgi:hypothetical protein